MNLSSERVASNRGLRSSKSLKVLLLIAGVASTARITSKYDSPESSLEDEVIDETWAIQHFDEKDGNKKCFLEEEKEDEIIYLPNLSPAFRFVDVSSKTEVLPKRFKGGLPKNDRFWLKDLKVGDAIGKGGNSTVFHGRLSKTQQPVAIKAYNAVIHDVENQFNRDVFYMNLLRDSPFICKLLYWEKLSPLVAYELFNNQSLRYVMVMEYASGGDLLDQINKHNWKWTDLLSWMSQIVVALQHLHARGIIHRDLKLENVLLNDLGDVRLIDFGLSKRFKTAHYSQTPRIVGTHTYIAPEYLESAHASYASDVFALGMLFYPFISENLKMYSELRPKMEEAAKKGIDMGMIAASYYKLPVHSDAPKGAEGLFRGMVHPDPKQRLTIKEIMQSDYFKGVDWRRLGALEAPLQK